MKFELLLTGLVGLALGVGATLLMVDRAGDRSDTQLDARSALSRERVDQIETRAAELDERIQTATEKITDRDMQISALQQRIADLKAKAESDHMVSEADILPAPAAEDVPGLAKGLDEYMDEMMNSEAGKAIMRVGTMQGLKVRYADLNATLGLSDEQVADFLELIADKELRGMQATGPVVEMDGDGVLDLSLDEDALAKIKQEETVLNDKIQAILGEQGYEYYKTYEHTHEDRQIVSALETAMGDSALPLDAAQKEQLLAVMIAERGDSMVMADSMKTLSADFDWEAAKSEVAQRNARILGHASGILYQEQYTMLEQLFEQKRSMMDMINIAVEARKSTVE
ncbi:MAG: hypothetical protein L3J88_07705 [Gammaproteobacteria bacterium]|nr:hypothetical protein [Gammaproteobacteria bacterium]MCF6363217.1 hypothetical protein [Gammaproteobacteria bacterium]